MKVNYAADPKSGLLLPSDNGWMRKFYIGESLCWKGEWFKLIHLNSEPPGVALYRVRPTEREERRKATRAKAKEKKGA